MSNLISILITYYNEKNLISRCLDSLNKQTKKPREVIIYDDASTEKAEFFINKKLYDFPIEILRNEENKGPGHGRNVLMQKAGSDYIRFQDADDELFENALEEIENCILRTGVDIILNEVSSFDENNELICERVIGLNSAVHNLFEFSLRHALLIPSITYKKSLVLSVGGFKDRSVLPQSEDSDFNRRVFLKSNNFSYIDLALAKQNIRSDSHSSKNYEEVWPSGLKSLLSIRKEIKPEHLPAYGEALLQTALHLYESQNYPIAKIAFKEYVAGGFSNYEGYNFIKKMLARTIGPLYTEQLSKLYRNLIPELIRRNFKGKSNLTIPGSSPSLQIRKVHPAVEQANGISVIICCFNSADRLPETLKHLALQTAPGSLPWEIIIVNNGSTDDTVKVAKAEWDKYAVDDVKFTIVDELKPGLTYARYCGTVASTYNIILFCDDDNWLSTNYLLNIVEHFQNYENLGIIGASNVYGAYEINPPKWFLRFKHFCAIYETGNQNIFNYTISSNIMVPGAGMGIRKEILIRYFENQNSENIILDRIKDSLLSGGDTDINYFALNEGYGLGLFTDISFKHYIPKNRINKTYLKKLAYSLSYSSVLVAAKNKIIVRRWRTLGLLKNFLIILLKADFFGFKVAFQQYKAQKDALNYLAVKDQSFK